MQLLNQLLSDAHRNGKLEVLLALQQLRDPVAELEARLEREHNHHAARTRQCNALNERVAELEKQRDDLRELTEVDAKIKASYLEMWAEIDSMLTKAGVQEYLHSEGDLYLPLPDRVQLLIEKVDELQRKEPSPMTPEERSDEEARRALARIGRDVSAEPKGPLELDTTTKDEELFGEVAIDIWGNGRTIGFEKQTTARTFFRAGLTEGRRELTEAKRERDEREREWHEEYKQVISTRDAALAEVKELKEKVEKMQKDIDLNGIQRRLNEHHQAQYLVQLTGARAAGDELRIERDSLRARLVEAEKERDEWRSRVGVVAEMVDSSAADELDMQSSNQELQSRLTASEAREAELRRALEEQRNYLEQSFCGCTVANEAGERDICGRCIALDEADKALSLTPPPILSVMKQMAEALNEILEGTPPPELLPDDEYNYRQVIHAQQIAKAALFAAQPYIK